MNRSSQFLATLKKLNCPQAYDFQGSDFDSFISNDELSSFFESFCNLTEDNVLTPEEVAEYDALTPNDLAELEKFEQNEKLQGSASEIEKAEAQYLKEKLSHIKEHCRTLEKQKERFVRYDEELLEEKDKCMKMLLESEEKFKTYTWQKVPKSETEYVSTLNTICKLAHDLAKIFTEIDNIDCILPMSSVFKKIIENYLEKEKELVEQIQQFLQSNFKYQEDNIISLQPCKDLHDKKVKELIFFQNVLKDATMANIRTVSEVKKSAAILNVLEQFEDKNHFQECFNFPSQLKSILNEVLDSNKKYKEKEKELHKFILHAVTKNTGMQCTEIAVSCAEHELNTFEYFSKIMILVLNALIGQKGRLEFLAICLNLLSIEMHNIVNLIGKLYNQFTAEQASFLDRKTEYEKLFNEAISPERTLSTNALFLSMYKISANVSDLNAQDAAEVSLDDILNRIRKYHEIKSVLLKQPGNYIATADTVEQYFVEAEELFALKNKDNMKWLEIERNININLNNLIMKLSRLEKKMREYQNYFDGQQKLIEQKGNWNMARYLYVFALTNRERFLKCVEEIEVAVQNSKDYVPSTVFQGLNHPSNS